LELAWGRDQRPVHPHHHDKSLGAENTFYDELQPGPDLERELYRLTDSAALRLRRAGWAARTVAIKVRTTDFKTVTRSRTLHTPEDGTAHLYAAARELLGAVDLEGKQVRLVGVRFEQLVALCEVGQQATFAEVTGTARAAEQASDAIRTRFGSKAVRPATLLDPRA
jgi:DNA polymerase-4